MTNHIHIAISKDLLMGFLKLKIIYFKDNVVVLSDKHRLTYSRVGVRSYYNSNIQKYYYLSPPSYFSSNTSS